MIGCGDCIGFGFMTLSRKAPLYVNQLQPVSSAGKSVKVILFLRHLTGSSLLDPPGFGRIFKLKHAVNVTSLHVCFSRKCLILQHVIRTPKSGVIEKVLYSAGQAVNRHAQLVQFQEQGEEPNSGDDDDEQGPEAE